jgi:hypothetical protein
MATHKRRRHDKALSCFSLSVCFHCPCVRDYTTTNIAHQHGQTFAMPDAQSKAAPQHFQREISGLQKGGQTLSLTEANLRKY